ncbi:MAG: RIP metalloprotease RseP [Candidatus Marinimicrobia bacterium]|nr:RIP metalloprotease RseP [Candidatus Neomarinimicrobiota bacterium]MCF7829234.1 RIP metalloprotease RseP [Candidatus Neomarinimicrobiota bacterium]MCF7881113.1 RIP metalloprotease RseP [Candidatus Neomarinimicrobiota bacterium]
MIINILAIIFALGLIILVHELGHFFAAKMSGVRVDRFSIGFPPHFFKKQKGETEYCLGAVPLGGYVKMAGMLDESMDEEIKGEPWEFASKSIPQKIFIMSAGVLMNFILAAIIFSFITLAQGIPESSDTTVVDQVVQDYPAAEAGMKPGARITSVNGEQVDTWQELTNIIHNLPNTEIDVTWVQNGETQSATLTTKVDRQFTDGELKEIGLIGISPEVHRRSAGLFESLGSGLSQTWWWGKVTVVSLKMLITGEESMKSVGGPIFIAKLAGDSARNGFMNLLNLVAIISINIGFLNILPVPALDGGHLVITMIEGIKGDPLSVKTRMIVQQVGMALLLTLMVFVIYNDIMRLL